MIEINYEGDPSRPTDERPAASIARFDDIKPTPQPASILGCNFDHLTWTYDFPASRWFDRGQLRKLDPGEYTDFQSHRESVEGPVERCIRVVAGQGILRTEYRDEPLKRFDLVTVPTGAAYQLGNTSTREFWIASWTSVGDDDLHESSMNKPRERIGAREEYKRVMAARKSKDLCTASEYTGEYDQNSDKGRPEPTVTHFSESMPKVFHKALEVGCNADRPDWITTTDNLGWFSDSVVMRIPPGTYASLHAHFGNEGPHEEVYWVVEGQARLITEYRDVQMSRFDCAFFPTNNVHSIGNVGTDTLWIGAWGARGGRDAEFELDDLEVSERPRQVEEYERVMTARKQRGLSTPPWVSVESE
jgi:oxalate decarboxylase/phosphoglucose isomerase-like protein (cupin superfamily)